MKIKGVDKLKGSLTIPGDKSISHRAVIFGAIAEGETTIHNILLSEDTLRTIKCFQDMGIDIEVDKNINMVRVKGKGLKGLKEAKEPLYCGNSGTTMRLLAGLLIGQDFPSTLTGDDSLSRRPMDRIISPLSQMGGNISGVDGNYPPLRIMPVDKIKNIACELPVASAQVKSAILLASLFGEGNSKIIEGKITRDHTERMLNYFEERNFQGGNIYVPGDISSAAFFIVAASIVKGSSLTLRDIGINHTRTGIIDILNKMGGNIIIGNERIINNEPVADIHVEYSRLKAIEISPSITGRLIDEIPIIAVAASFAQGKTIINGAEELKYKETDRIHATVTELGKMGVDIEALPDGLWIKGPNQLRPASLKSYGDHRIAMALAIAALNTNGESEISDSECISISFPNFFDMLVEIS